MGAGAVRAVGRARHRCGRDRRRHVRTGRRFRAPARRHQQYQNPQWFNKTIENCSYSYDFFASKDGKYFNIISKLKEISIDNKNLYLFDSLNLMCPNLKCAYAEKGEMLYINDPDHLSNYSSRYIIAPAIIKFIEEI